MKSVRIKTDDGSYICIKIIGYERDPNGDFHDSNWLMSSIEAKIGRFSTEYNLSILTNEIVIFRDQLVTLYKDLRGIANLETMEGQIQLSFIGNGRGSIKLNGYLKDRAGDGHELKFVLSLDQSYLINQIDEIDEIITTYPIIK